MATRSLRCAAVALVVTLAAMLSASAQQGQLGTSRDEPQGPVAIEIRSEPITSFDHRDYTRRRFGRLDYRGGLVLTSPFKEFGGLSSLSMAADGANFLAASDRGWWLRGRITYNG